jgi:hypothetical protein
MKMPEGWNRIAKEVVELRKWEEEGRPGDRVATLSGVWCGDMAEALSLLRAMAQTLEQYARTELGEYGNPEPNLALVILDKFKEWK